MSALLTILALAALVGGTFAAVHFSKPLPPPVDTRTPEEIKADRQRMAALRRARANDLLIQQQGPIRPQLICPHCQVRGQVRCKAVTNKKGVSGGKATAAVLTGGVSMLATGLSRKEAATAATCGNCQSEWQF